MLVHLVAQRAARPRAGLPFVGRDRPEEAAGPEVGQVPHRIAARFGEPCRQGRRLVDHRHRVAEQHHGLVLLRAGGIDLGAGLAVGQQAIEPDPRQQRRLAVALAFLVVEAAEPARPVRLLPAEQRADAEGLRGMQVELPSLELAAVQAQHHREEGDRPHRRGKVPGQPAAGAAREIVEVAPAGVPDMRPGDDASGDDVLGPGGDGIVRRDRRRPGPSRGRPAARR